MGGDLSRGTLEGTVVTCPRHGSQFDVRDGHVVRWLKGKGLLSRLGAMLKSSRPLRTYNVRTERGDILVQAE
jgi:3-phenylpropionate/trans-cinnamate dioxygenase ferredoxin subunit